MSTDIHPRITEIEDYSPHHSRITLEPFERGYGHTLGNALRRIILSALPGFAATSVRIQGAEHPYSTLDGIAEDVIEILLNVKGISFRIDGGDRSEVRLNRHSPGIATAGDLELPGGVHVLNPEHQIATLSEGVGIDMTITVEKGHGYRIAPVADKTIEKTTGTIPLDAAFSPVRNVAFDVESSRVGDRTDLDRLIMEIKSTGVYNPEQIVRFAARRLTDQLKTFAELDRDMMPIEDRAQTAASDPKLFEPIEILELSVREANILKQGSIRMIGDLITKSEKDLLSLPRIGRKIIDGIKMALAQHQLALADDASMKNRPANAMKAAAPASSDQIDPKMHESIDTLNLTPTISTKLKEAEIEFIGELIVYNETDLRSLAGLDKRGLDRIKLALDEQGLTLGTSVSGFKRS